MFDYYASSWYLKQVNWISNLQFRQKESNHTTSAYSKLCVHSVHRVTQHLQPSLNSQVSFCRRQLSRCWTASGWVQWRGAVHTERKAIPAHQGGAPFIKRLRREQRHVQTLFRVWKCVSIDRPVLRAIDYAGWCAHREGTDRQQTYRWRSQISLIIGARCIWTVIESYALGPISIVTSCG